jgi:transitional endoplasmic reticulum ATPase
VDPALLRPGRFDKIMYIPPPDYTERIDILRVHIAGKPLEDKINLEEIAKRTEGFSGADLANLVKEAATGAMRRSMKTQKITAITHKDFQDILPRIKPSISLTMKEEYERIKMRYERKAHDYCRNEQKLALNIEAVCGLDDVKKELRESVILPLTNRNLVEKFKLKTGRAILLHSPPGCGKTYLMKAISNQYNIPFQEVTGSELKNAILADGTLAIKGLWASVRDMAPAILFISDIDSIASTDRLKEEEGQKAYSIFVSMLDNIKPTDRVVLVATSQDPDDLNPSLFARGRFERQISLSPPDATARKRMFELNLKDVPRIGKIDINELVKATDGFSGEDINSVIDDAKVLALSKDDILFKRKGGPKVSLGIKMEDLLRSIYKIKPAVSEWEKRKAHSKERRDLEMERAKKDKEISQTPVQTERRQPPPPPMVQAPPPPVYTPPPPPPPRISPSAEDIAIMTIAQLEEACREFGLKPYGKKNILQDRLTDYLKDNNGGS